MAPQPVNGPFSPAERRHEARTGVPGPARAAAAAVVVLLPHLLLLLVAVVVAPRRGGGGRGAAAGVDLRVRLAGVETWFRVHVAQSGLHPRLQPPLLAGGHLPPRQREDGKGGGGRWGGGGFGRPLARARLLTALSSCLSLTARAGGDAAGGLRGEYRAGTAWVVVPHQRLEADVGSRVLFCPAGIVRGWGCLSSCTPWPVVQLPQSGAGLLCSVSGLLLLHCSYNIPSPPCSFPFRRARGV